MFYRNPHFGHVCVCVCVCVRERERKISFHDQFNLAPLSSVNRNLNLNKQTNRGIKVVGKTKTECVSDRERGRKRKRVN